MANKKVIMSVTLGAAIASAVVGAEETNAASHKVQSGDSLWNIAQKYNTSVQSLIDVNKLRSDIIFPNQVLKTTATSSNSNSSGSNTNKSNNNKNETTSSVSKYKVKSGDTLSGIASKHNISLNNLMKWNNLNTTLIYPGNVLVVQKQNSNNSSSSSNSSSPSNSSDKKKSTSSSTIYTVKSGDTLSQIGANYGVTVSNLKKWNTLSSDRIYIGQKINIGASKKTTSSSNETLEKEKPTGVDYNVSKLIEKATSLEGASYAWGGSTPSGFDCSGYIYHVYKQADKEMVRHSSQGYYDRSYYVNNPKVGDLVFFEGTYKSGISHMGIYLGDNQFIHAGSKGVEIVSLNNSYWKKHFSSYKRFY